MHNQQVYLLIVSEVLECVVHPITYVYSRYMSFDGHELK